MGRILLLHAAFGLVILHGALLAQTQVVLSSEAQAAMEKGLGAAKSQKWDVAIQHFSDACKAEPLAPQTLFNLALAHDKCGGHELLAQVWYHTYLTAAPKAPNASLVRSHLGELEKKTFGLCLDLARTASEAAQKLPKEGHPEKYLVRIAALQAAAGDTPAAAATAEGLSPANKYEAARNAVIALAKRGDVASAKTALVMMENYSPDTMRGEACREIGDAMIKRGDFEGALEFSRSMPIGEYTKETPGAIINSVVFGMCLRAKELAERGAAAEARVQLGKAESTSVLITDNSNLVRDLCDMAAAYAAANATDDAQRVARKACDVFRSSKETHQWLYFGTAQRVVEAMATAGLRNEARSTAATVLGEALKRSTTEFGSATDEICELACTVPDVEKEFPAAGKVARRVLSDFPKVSASKEVSRGQLQMNLLAAGQTMLRSANWDGALEVLGVFEKEMKEYGDEDAKLAYESFVSECDYEFQKVGKSSKALALAIDKMSKDSPYRRGVLGDAIRGYVKSGDLDRALETAKKLPEDSQVLYSDIVYELAKSGQVSRAQTIANQLKNKDAKAVARRSVVDGLAERAEWAKAGQLIPSLESTLQQIVAWVGIADLRLKRQEAAEAKAALANAEALIPKLESASDRSAMWKQLVWVYTGQSNAFLAVFKGNGDFASAREVAARIPDPKVRAYCLDYIPFAELEKAGGPPFEAAKRQHEMQFRRENLVRDFERLADRILNKPWSNDVVMYLDSLRAKKSNELVGGLISAGDEMMSVLNEFGDLEAKSAALALQSP
jgi:hypothetical protein